MLTHGIVEQKKQLVVVSATLSVDSYLISFTTLGALCSGYTNTVNVTASSGNSWTAIPVDSWCIVTGGSGTGNGSFTVSCSGKSLSDRTTKINITSSAPTVQIQVNQGTCLPPP